MKRCVIVGGADINNYSYIRNCLREDDYIIFCDSGLKHMDALQVIPGLIVGDFDSHDNPHFDNKSHIELEQVENLPLATKLDILTESKERKYFTWAQLDNYMKRFLLTRRPQKEEQLKTKDENIMRYFSVVFSNCGQNCDSISSCRTYPEITQPPTTT